MNKLHRLNSLLFLLAVAMAACIGRSEERERPNLLFIFTDDQRADAVGFSGNRFVQTPNLDRLAYQGTIFDRAYVTTSICAVSRACVLTGQYARRHGVDDFYKVLNPKQIERTYPALLHDAGYYTGFIGKWGIGDTPENIEVGADLFDYWAGASHQTNFWHERDCVYLNHDGVSDKKNNVCDCPADDRGFAGPEIRIGQANLKDPVHLTSEVLPEKFDQFLASREDEKPFCMSLFLKAVHSPFEDYHPDFASLHEGQNLLGLSLEEVREGQLNRPGFLEGKLGVHGEPIDQRKLEEFNAKLIDYYRLIANMDDALGQVFASLEKEGVAENTVVLFVSDNGQFFGEHGLGGKWLMYEPSIRVPGFIYDPRVDVTHSVPRTEGLVLQIDFMATLLDYAGIGIPNAVQGQSLRPLVGDSEAEGREYLFYEHAYTHGGMIEPTEGIVDDRFKYTRYYGQDPIFEELFDLERDPGELNNLVDNARYAVLLDRMRKHWEESAGALR